MLFRKTESTHPFSVDFTRSFQVNVQHDCHFKILYMFTSRRSNLRYCHLQSDLVIFCVPQNFKTENCDEIFADSRQPSLRRYTFECRCNLL